MQQLFCCVLAVNATLLEDLELVAISDDAVDARQTILRQFNNHELVADTVFILQSCLGCGLESKSLVVSRFAEIRISRRYFSCFLGRGASRDWEEGPEPDETWSSSRIRGDGRKSAVGIDPLDHHHDR